jgi:phosphoribosylglycinamide formyltransferase-1
MTIVCFVSGSGTNYREIVKYNPDHEYLVFTNRPGCGGEIIARQYGHPVVHLSHTPFLKGCKQKYGEGKTPRNCAERIAYDQELSHLIEEKLGRQPDLICLAGYDQWLTDWLVTHYYPRLLNVHPGDTTKGYDGLHWIPTAKAILAGEESIRSTVFIVDTGEDTGPVLVQSAPVDIPATVKKLESEGERGLTDKLWSIREFSTANNIRTFEDFTAKAPDELKAGMEQICRRLQDILKVSGDWKIYPFAVHELIARGRVALEGRTVYIDGKPMPEYGLRLDEQ